MEQLSRADYIEAVKAIKEAIQQSRYRVAKLVNSEVLSLYYAVGRYISLSSRNARYGTNALHIISQQLQQEMPGLSGFSESSMKRMRRFYEGWCNIIENRPLAVDDFGVSIIPFDNKTIVIRPLTVDEFTKDQMNDFLSVPFIHHYEILTKTTTLNERLFYIRKCATEFWTKESLIANLKADCYHTHPATNNFRTAIPDERLRAKAMQTFKQEMVLDFLHIPDSSDFTNNSQQNNHPLYGNPKHGIQTPLERRIPVFFRAGFIESWGRGYEKIREAFRKENLQTPAFEQVRGGFLATVKRERFVAIQTPNGVNNGVENVVNNVVNNNAQLTERQQKILKLIWADPYMPASKMSQILSVVPRTVQRELAVMQKLNVIRRDGTKGGRWIVTTIRN